MRVVPDWDEYYLNLCDAISLRSKDPKTQVGAVIVRPNHTPVSFGYNGFEAGALENDELWTPGEKHKHVIHAEENAITHSYGEDLKDCTIYCPRIPCHRCATKIVAHRFSKVVFNYNRQVIRGINREYRLDDTRALFDYWKVELKGVTLNDKRSLHQTQKLNGPTEELRNRNDAA